MNEPKVKIVRAMRQSGRRVALIVEGDAAEILAYVGACLARGHDEYPRLNVALREVIPTFVLSLESTQGESKKEA